MDDIKIDEQHKHKKGLNIWFIISGVLVVLLIVSLFTNGFNFSLGKDGAAEKALTYIKNVPTVGNVVLNDVSEEKNLYKLSMTIDGQDFESYITKDGSLLIPGVIDLNQKVDLTNQDSNQNSNNAPVTQIEIGASYVKGNKDAPITIIEFSDFQCPFCERFYSDTLPQIIKNYVDTGKAKFVYKHFPLVSIHSSAQKAAEASECAGEQGKFWEYHNTLFENQQSLDVASLKKYAVQLGLNSNKFNDCLDSGKYESKVNDDLKEGSAAGVTGTPAFFINGQKLVGAQPYESFKPVIDSELQK